MTESKLVYETRRIKPDDMGFLARSLDDHMNELARDGKRIISVIAHGDEVVIITSKEATDAHQD